MDPLSLTASIIAVLKLTGTVLSYLTDVKDSSPERANLAIEASIVYSLLTTLRYRVEKAKSGDPWYTAIRNLGAENGALDQYHIALEQLASKVGPGHHETKSFTKPLRWKFDKIELSRILSKIERLKTLISLALENDLFTLSETIKDDVTALHKRVEGMQLSQESEKRQAFANWLSPLDFKSRQRDVFMKRQEGTGQWFLESQEFKVWHDEPYQTLWCPGIPGAGKTVLASMVVDHLQTIFKGKNVATACIYCDYKAKGEQTAPNLLASLLKQIVQDCSTLSGNLKPLYDDYNKRKSHPAPEDVSIALQSEIATFSRMFIVVDALDECTEEGSTRADLLDELRSLPNKVNLMVTSRNIPAIKREFEGVKSLEIHATDADVVRYITSRLQREHRLARHVKADPVLHDTVVNAILDKAKGMFLLVKLHMDSLVSKNNRKAIRIALENLPKSIEATYDETMQRIEAQNQEDRELADKVLSWISYALRPLSITELQHALAVDEYSTKTELDALPDQEILISVCAGLVVVDDESNAVRLVHYTTQEYFDGTRKARYPDAQKSIVATCLTYLSFDEFGKGECQDRMELESRLERNALLDYVAQQWGDHARGEPEGLFQETLLQLLQDSARVSCYGQIILNSRHYFTNISRHRSKQMTGAHLAAYFGLSNTIASLLEQGMAADSMSDGLQTPLSMAAERGRCPVVKLLIERDDVAIDSKDIRKRTPLHWAALNGHKEAVRLLLRAGARVDSRSNREHTPLHSAAQNGHVGVVKLLLEAKSDINALSDTETTPLYRAARVGHVETIKVLLAAGADVNIATFDGYTALRSAVGYNQIGSVMALLQAAPDMNILDVQGQTALEVAKQHRFESIVRMLEDAESHK